MSESLSNLNDLTTRMNAPIEPTLNEYGEVETVDEKLSRATLLIKDAQETLLSAQATEKILALKDDEIVLLKEQLRMSLSDLEAAISEIAHVRGCRFESLRLALKALSVDEFILRYSSSGVKPFTDSL